MFSARTKRLKSDRTRWMALLGALVVVLLASADAYAHGVAEGDKGAFTTGAVRRIDLVWPAVGCGNADRTAIGAAAQV